VHLYPVIKNEYYGSTLAETQACGLPVVIYQGSEIAISVKERGSDDETGYVAPDDYAFANLVVQLLLKDADIYGSLAYKVETQKAARNWQKAAIEFETLWK
jgi:glycosyltransferase involved in cell wall biosynthesis